MKLSVVVPCFNDGAYLPATIDALVSALDGGGFDAELVVVDDGSDDGTAEIARRSIAERVDSRVLVQPNRGRFEARRAGLAAAEGELVLLLDARVRLEPDGLRFVHSRVELGEEVWNGHVHVESDNDLGRFWGLLAELAWRDYFDEPRTTSFGADDFDRFPKGLGCFLAPRSTLADAFSKHRTRYADVRLANDDTPILRDIARTHRIGISPCFACTYAPRTTLPRFFRHAIRRGVVFLDGHGTSESRLFPAVVAFFPVSAALALSALRRPLVAPAAVAASGVAAAIYGARAGRSRDEVRALLLVTPPYAVGHGLGMWRGLYEIVRARAGP